MQRYMYCRCTHVLLYIHCKYNNFFLHRMVATVSNITSWLFWNSLTKGKTRAGRYSTSLNSGLQWLRAESVLEKEIYFIKE